MYSIHEPTDKITFSNTVSAVLNSLEFHKRRNGKGRAWEKWEAKRGGIQEGDGMHRQWETGTPAADTTMSLKSILATTEQVSVFSQALDNKRMFWLYTHSLCKT
ncbi:hypothetical protein BaRGS_00022642 [Batillaria attramentaria]|uniref:Uncharacterized protein n=1 Tax=Batillaria attramentaria TaxID=370345 RepID=A0ABD0KG58_9CAEN